MEDMWQSHAADRPLFLRDLNFELLPTVQELGRENLIHLIILDPIVLLPPLVYCSGGLTGWLLAVP